MAQHLRARSLLLASLIAALGLPGVASADAFSVQIGAFRHPSSEFAEAALGVGPLTRSPGPDGIVRLRIGRYATVEQARVAQARLRSEGYPDAFVVPIPPEAEVDAQPPVPNVDRSASHRELPRNAADASPNGRERFTERGEPDASPASVRDPAPAPESDADPLAAVPASLRDRVVILDGTIHVIEGERFIPLHDYLAGDRSRRAE